MVDAQGRVEDVGIDQRWRSRLNPDGLLAALLDTYRAARISAGEAFAVEVLATTGEAGGEPPDSDDGKGGGEPLRPFGPGIDREERWRRIRDMRAEFHANRERRERIVAEAHQPREHTGPHGYLTATVQWGAIVTVTGDSRQIEYASVEHLRRDALAVLSLANPPPGEMRRRPRR